MPDSHLSLMARDYKFFEAAKKAAGDSDFKVRVGAVAVYRRRVVASAASHEKTHSLQKVYNKYRDFNQVGLCLPKVHAEIALLAKLRKMDVCMQDVSVYVYRVCKSREKGMARPCEACMMALKEAGIRTVLYTTDIGYCAEVLDSA